ncbi:MAG: cyclic nucleotide-binding domain-containing protein [Acidimicrobiia bacterium]|nr:cyclic nucleotide-binding domain-containing protein [Acidimicrobiia bacterium]
MARRSDATHPLKDVALFADVTRADLVTIGKAVTQLDLPDGYVLIREGGRDRDMFVVVSGTVEITRDGEHLADVGPGEFVGEMAMLTGAGRNATVTATTPVRVLHVDGRAASAVIAASPQVASKMLPVVAQRTAPNRVLVDA